jgi:putative serine protease PepD
VDTETRPDPDSRPKRRPTRLALLGASVLAAGAAGAGVLALAQRTTDEADGPPASSTQPAVLVASPSLTVGEIYERSAAGVVDIEVAGGGGGFGQTEGEGSGFVLDEEGSIVTNAHVVEGASTITVIFSDGQQAPATVVGVDASTDVAILDVDVPAEELTALPLGSSAEVEVGDPVVAIGSPFGLAGTVTSGIVSALDRTVDAPNGYPISGAIQTDAAINPGNSGGPLLDAAGEVIGVNAQIRSNSGGNDGVGFAIPIDTVRQVAEQLVAGEEVQHAYLGVSLATVDSTAAEALGIPEGAQIVSVQDGSPAAEAGLRAGTQNAGVGGETFTRDGDVITAVDGTPVSSADDLGTAIAAHEPGDTVTLTVFRDGSSTSVEVTLGVRPS